MATTQLTHIVYPNGDTSNSIPFVVGTGTTAGTWLGTLEGLTAYYDGLLILYKSPVAGASTTTLNLNGLGAKTVYLNHTTKLTTHYPANQPILLAYSTSQNSGCWEAIDNYDSNTNTLPNSLFYYNNTYAKTELLANTIIVGDSNGYSSVAANVSFDISYPILWTTAKITQGTSNYANMYIQCYDRNLTTVKSGFSSSAKKIIYLVVTIDGNIATIDSTILTDTLPSTDDGKVYITLGRLGAQSTGANYFNFQVTHPMFWYKNGKIIPYSINTDAQTVNGHTVEKDVPSNAVFTDTTYTASKTNVGSASLGTAISIGTSIISNWNAGALPSLTITDTDCDDITAWSAGTAASASVTKGVLTITNGTAPSLSYTARSVGSASQWVAGTAPVLEYDSTTTSVPNVSVQSVEVVNKIQAVV